MERVTDKETERKEGEKREPNSEAVSGGRGGEAVI